MQYQVLNNTLTFAVCEQILEEITEPLIKEIYKEEVFYWRTSSMQTWLYDRRKLRVRRSDQDYDKETLFLNDGSSAVGAMLGEYTSYWHKHAARFTMPNDLVVSFARYCTDKQGRLFVEIDGARLSDRKWIAKELQLILDLTPITDGPEKLFCKR